MAFSRLRGCGLRHLLQLDSSAGLLELLLEALGLGLLGAFLYLGGHAVHEVLGFLEPEAGGLAEDLDDLDLLVPEARG